MSDRDIAFVVGFVAVLAVLLALVLTVRPPAGVPVDAGGARLDNMFDAWATATAEVQE